MAEVVWQPEEREDDPPGVMTLATLAAAAARAHEATADDREGAARERAHPQPLEYVQVAIALVVVEVLEVVVYYLDVLGGAALPILMGLTIVQFALVAMWYMHLKFDSRFFSWLFVLGMILAAAVFIAAWSTLDILL